MHGVVALFRFSLFLADEPPGVVTRVIKKDVAAPSHDGATSQPRVLVS